MLSVQINNSLPRDGDSLRINRNKRVLEGTLTLWTLKDGDYSVAIIPSLNLSGYGDNKESAIEMLNEAVEDYLLTLIKVKPEAMEADLHKFGWVRNPRAKKNFTAPFIDKKGVLQNFSLPENTEVEETILSIG